MKSTRNGCMQPRLGALRRTGLGLVVTVLVVAGCGPNRGPGYGANPMESKTLAVPPDLSAEPLAAQNPYPNLPDVSRFRPGPQPAEAKGKWAARVHGNTLTAAIPKGWALGTVRAALLMQGVAIHQEREGILRTGWLRGKDLSHLGVPAPEQGPIRFTVQTQSVQGGGARIVVQGKVRNDGEVRAAPDKPVKEFLLAVQPAFGKRH